MHQLFATLAEGITHVRSCYLILKISKNLLERLLDRIHLFGKSVLVCDFTDINSKQFAERVFLKYVLHLFYLRLKILHFLQT